MSVCKFLKLRRSDVIIRLNFKIKTYNKTAEIKTTNVFSFTLIF